MAARAVAPNKSVRATLALRRGMDPAMFEKRCMRHLDYDMFSKLMKQLPGYKATSAVFLTEFMVSVIGPDPSEEDYEIFENILEEPKKDFGGIQISYKLINTMVSQLGQEKPIIFPYITYIKERAHYLVAVAYPTGVAGEYDIDVVPTYALKKWMAVDVLGWIGYFDARIKIREVHDVVTDLNAMYKTVINLQTTPAGTCSNWGFKIADFLAEAVDVLNKETYEERLTTGYVHMYDYLKTISDKDVEFLKTELIVGEGLPENYANKTYYRGTPNSNDEPMSHLVPGVNTILTAEEAGIIPFREHANYPENSNAFNSNYSPENSDENMAGGGRRRRRTRRHKKGRKQKTLRKQKGRR